MNFRIGFLSSIGGHLPRPCLLPPPRPSFLGFFQGLTNRWLSKRVVFADVPPERKPERGYIRNDSPERKPDRNEGTFGCSPGTKTGTRLHSPKPPFHEIALLSPGDFWSQATKRGIVIPTEPLKSLEKSRKRRFVHKMCVHDFWCPLSPPPTQQSGGFSLESVLLQVPQAELRTNSPKIANKQNYEQTGVAETVKVQSCFSQDKFRGSEMPLQIVLLRPRNRSRQQPYY